MTSPPPTVHRFRLRWRWIRTSALAACLVGVLGTWVACAPSPESVVVIASELVEVSARPSATEERAIAELTVRHADGQWTIRTRIPDLKRPADILDPSVVDTLRRGVVWADPYLFVREDLGNREASRSSVDHVFHCTPDAVRRLGTLSARFGPPGSQVRNGVFRDTYDRLEFSPLTPNAEAAVFDIYLREENGRFTVDTGITWSSGEGEFQRRLTRLRALNPPGEPTTPTTPAALREARALALFCLAFTRYCERPAEHEAALETARTVLPTIDDVLEEVETVRPGELAASRDEVLRAHPSLVNFFKESPDQPDPSDEPEIPVAPDAGLPVPGLNPP